MTTLYLVEYNDCYGNGNNKSIEVIVKDRNAFLKWLDERNAERDEMGEIEESEDEFNLIPVQLFDNQ